MRKNIRNLHSALRARGRAIFDVLSNGLHVVTGAFEASVAAAAGPLLSSVERTRMGTRR